MPAFSAAAAPARCGQTEGTWIIASPYRNDLDLALAQSGGAADDARRRGASVSGPDWRSLPGGSGRLRVRLTGPGLAGPCRAAGDAAAPGKWLC